MDAGGRSPFVKYHMRTTDNAQTLRYKGRIETPKKEGKGEKEHSPSNAHYLGRGKVIRKSEGRGITTLFLRGGGILEGGRIKKKITLQLCLDSTPTGPVSVKGGAH